MGIAGAGAGTVFGGAKRFAPNGAPSLLTLTVNSDTAMTANWTIGSTNHDGHRIYISTDGVNFTEKGTVTGSTATYQATGLTAGTKYYFYVKAYNNIGESAASNTAYATAFPVWFVPDQVNNVLIAGDSYVVGIDADDPETHGWAGLITSQLKAILGDAGDGARFLNLRPGSQVFSDNFYQWTDNFSDGTNQGAFGSFTQRGDNSKTATITVTGKIFDILYFRNASSYHKFNIIVDGGDPVAITTTTRPAVDTAYLERITCATNGTHTIEISGAADMICDLAGVICYNGDNGVNVIKYAISGGSATLFRPALYPDTIKNSINTYKPILTIVALGLNDYEQQLDIDTYEDNITEFVTYGMKYGQVVIVNNIHYHDGKTIPIEDYNTRLSNICTATGAVLVNMHDVMGSIAEMYAAGLINGINYGHPTTAGHAAFADEIYDAITEIATDRGAFYKPAVDSAVLENNTPTKVEITFDKVLNETSIPDVSAFTLAGKTITNVAIDEFVVTLTVSVAYAYGDVITVNYTKPGSNPLKTLSGGDQADSFSGQAVTNNLIDPSTEFVTTWKTDNTGTTNSTSIRLPLQNTTTYNALVNWGDGVYETIVRSGKTYVDHDYGTAGTYTVRISGTFPRIYFAGQYDKAKILSISQWGTIEWSNMASAFLGCSNLTLTATDTPDLSSVTSLASMFRVCSAFAGHSSMSSWDISGVTDMSYTFSESAFNIDISSWDTGNVTTMQGLFYAASAFNQNIGSWDVSKVTNMYYMFRYRTTFNQNLSSWNISLVTDMTNMLQGTALSTVNYDALLIGWAALASVKPNVPFGVGTVKYSAGAAATARGVLTGSPNTWTITDGGQV